MKLRGFVVLGLCGAVATGCEQPSPPSRTAVARVENQKVVVPRASVVAPTPEVVSGSHSDVSTVDHFTNARTLRASGDSVGALRELEMGLFDEPDNVEGYWQLATLLWEVGEKEQALVTTEVVMNSAPDDMQALTFYVRGLLDLNRGAQAVEPARRLSRAPGTELVGLHLLTRAYIQQSMWNEAIGAGEQGIEMGATSPEVFNNVGLAQIMVGKYPEAAENLSVAVESPSARHYMWNNYGLALEKGGDLVKAYQAYQTAATISPTYVKAIVNIDRVTKVAVAQGVTLGEATVAGVSTQEEGTVVR